MAADYYWKEMNEAEKKLGFELLILTDKYVPDEVLDIVLIMGSVLVIILSISEQLQMKRLLVLTVVGLRHQRREHILILHSVSFSQDFEP